MSNPSFEYEVLSKTTQDFTSQVDEKNKQKTIRSVRKGVAALCKVVLPTFIDKNDNEKKSEIVNNNQTEGQEIST